MEGEQKEIYRKRRKRREQPTTDTERRGIREKREEKLNSKKKPIEYVRKTETGNMKKIEVGRGKKVFRRIIVTQKVKEMKRYEEELNENKDLQS